MQTDYVVFVDRMITHYEGGYCWDAGDNGGPTKYGITCYDLAEHRHQTMTSMAAWAPIVKSMTLVEAEAIYAEKYAKQIMFDQLKPGKDVVMFDYAVNSGSQRAVRSARALLNRPGSGVMTKDLLDAINAADAKWFVNAMCDERLHFMQNIRNGTAWKKFGHGWASRITDLRTYAVNLIGALTTAPPTVLIPRAGKGVNVDPQALPIHPGVVVGGGASGAASAAAGHPWWVVALLVVGLIAIGFIAAKWLKSKDKKADETVVLPDHLLPLPPAPGTAAAAA